MNGKQLFLKPDEVKFISIAVMSKIEDLQATTKNQLINWNPETRKDLKDMLAAGNSLRIKMQRLGFDMRDLPPFEDGDYDTFLTKQS